MDMALVKSLTQTLTLRSMDPVALECDAIPGGFGFFCHDQKSNGEPRKIYQI